MAEAVGLAASVAGLLSLGLQITGGIATYLDALENRHDELASVKRQNDALSTALVIIKAATSRFQSQPHDHAVTANIQACEAELQAIEELLADLANCDTSTWRQRLRSTKKKLSYAFDRSKVQQLAQRLHQANEILQLTLTGLGLDISGSVNDKLTVIESTSRSHASELLLLRSEVAAATTPAAHMRDQMPLLQGGIDATSELVVSHSVTITNQIQESSRATQHGVERSHESLQLTLGLQMEKMERLEQLLETLQSNSPRNQSIDTLACRAASKPAALKELCDSIHDPKHHVPLEVSRSGHSTSGTIKKPWLGSITGRICICPRPHRSSTHRRIQLGHFHLSGELENHGHWPGCPLSKGQSSRQTRKAAGLKYTGLGRMLQSVIGISFTMTSGAGGLSIGPTLTYHPTVDPDSDPAFRVLYLINDAVHISFIKGNIFTFIQDCIRKLARIFDEKKSCPTAMSPHNGNLMHIAIQLFHIGEALVKHPDLFPDFSQLVRTLLGYGVPAFSYDDDGRSPLVYITGIRPWVSLELIELLVQANLEMKPLQNNCNAVNKPKPKVSLSWYDSCHGYAEACECGPLSMAVVRSNLAEVTCILKRSPESISEVNIHGRCPLQLAASKADILKHLLRFAKQHHLNQRDYTHFSVLETAMLFSSDLCVNGSSSEICRGCACVASVDLLLEAGCVMRIHRHCRGPGLYELLEPASELARRHYIFHLTEHQAHQTSAFFENTLSPDPSQSSGGNFGSHIPSAATVEERPTDFGDNENRRQLSWVYEEIYDSHLAGLFYACGIRPDPSIFIHPECYQFALSDKYNTAAHLFWLLQHGADLYLKSPTEPSNSAGDPNVGVFGAHYAFFTLGRAMQYAGTTEWAHPFGSVGAWTEVATTVIRDHLNDGCECHCSTVGCDPFVGFLHGLLDERSSPRTLQNSMGAFYSRCGTDLTALTFKAAIRYATFQALGLAHTCCGADALAWGFPKSDRNVWLGKKEAKTINEDQALLLKLHEELVSEFQEKATEYIDEESGVGSGFALFWSEYWIVKMEEELEKLDGANLTDEERRGAEEIGVRWCEPPRTKKRRRNPYADYTVEHLYFELDSICPEIKEPWPEGLTRVEELS